MRFYVAFGAFHIDRTAGSRGINATARLGDLRGAGKGADAHIALDVGNGDRAGSAVSTDVVADIVGANRAAQCGKLGLPLDVVHANGAGSRLRFYRAAHILNRLRAREQSRCNFRIARNLNHVRNVDVAQVAHLLADMNRAAVLLDRWIGEQLIEALLGALESHAGRVGVRMDMHFAVGAAGDGDVAGSVVELQANRAAYAERAVKAAADRWSHRAARACQGGKQEACQGREIAMSHRSSMRVQGEAATAAVQSLATERYADERNYVPNTGSAQERFCCGSVSLSEPWR